MASWRLALFVASGVAGSGCSLLSLDVLQASEEGQGGANSSTSAAATSAAETSSVGPTAGSGGGSTSSSSGLSASSAGGGGGGPATTSTGSACPDVCAGIDAAFCDAFDGPDGLSQWQTALGFENGSTFDIVTDPHVSCPHAARVDFSGVDGASPGGWAELERALPGSPTHITLTTRVRRSTANVAMEGVMEFYWSRDEKQCQVQVQVDPNAAQVFAREFDDQGNGTELGGAYVDLGQASTIDTWLEVELEMQLVTSEFVSLKIGGADPQTFSLDGEEAGECDDIGPEPGSFSVLLGAPFNSAATTLYYDDVVIRAE